MMPWKGSPVNTAVKERPCHNSSPVRTGAFLPLIPPLLVVGVLVIGLAKHPVLPHATNQTGPGLQEAADNSGFEIPVSVEQRRRLGHIYAIEIKYTYRAAQFNRARRRIVSPGERRALDASYIANAQSYNAIAVLYPEAVHGKRDFPRRLPALNDYKDNATVRL
jgi:hypothetical protein